MRLQPAALRLAALLAGKPWPPKVIARWQVFLDACQKQSSRSSMDPRIAYLAGKLLPMLAALRRGEVEVKVERTPCRLAAEESGIAPTEMARERQRVFWIRDIFGSRARDRRPSRGRR